MTTSAPIIEFNGVNKWYGEFHVLRDIQLHVARGERIEGVRDARSEVREAYTGYRSAYDIARHQRDEVVPLNQRIAQENVLRYNGMLIGVFELLADNRTQINSVLGAINAYQQFWLADAALAASMTGKPTAMMMATPMGAGDASAGH